MTKLDSTRFNMAGPIFRVTASRARKILDSRVFLILMLDSDLDFDLYIEDEGYPEDSARYYQEIRAIDPELRICIRNISKISLFKPNESDRFIAKLKEILNVSTLLISPFSMDNLGFGYAIWGWEEHARFGDDAYVKASLIAEQIALSLSASMNQQRSKEQGDKLAGLLELSTSICSSLNYKEVLEKGVKLSMEIVGATGGTIMSLDKEEEILKPILTVDEKHADAINSMRLRLGEGLAGIVAESGVGIVSNHSESDPRSIQVPGTPVEPESLISAPLTWSGEVIGVITLWNNTGKFFDQEDLEILTIFARQTADAIENAKLYEKLEKAYEELSATQERLIMAEKLKALADMAGGVAHDFNNILGAILGRIQLLLTKIDNPQWKKDLEAIEKASLEGRRTVQRLQDFTNVSSRSQNERLDLNIIIEQAIDHTRPAWKDNAQKKGITIKLHNDLKPVAPIEGNQDELIEAISNVILNSVDALTEGGNIRISTSMENDKVVLSVADDGIGMDANTQNKLFFPFFSTKDEQGSGMGLAVVYGIMFRHQVDISVESSPGQGAEFVFRFNALRESKAEKPDVSEPEETCCLSILLVDDDTNLLEVVADMIDYLGHDCCRADGGKAAIEILGERKFDLVVTDLGMPDVGGWEVAEFCRAKNPNVPIVLISGWGAQIDGNEALQKVDAVLPKPFKIEEFKETIDRVISNARKKQPV